MRLARSKEGYCICGKKTDKTKFPNIAGKDEDKANKMLLEHLACKTSVLATLCRMQWSTTEI